MPFDGNGNFELLYDFEADRDAGFPSNRILAEKMMDMFQDVAAGLEGAAAESAERLSGTSATSTAIGTGSKVFTTQADKAFTVGRWLLLASDADEANYMHGRVTAYSGTSLTVEVTNVGGSGTLADWTISVSGTQGGTGGTGLTGAQGAMAAVPYNYSTTTTDSDPGSGNLRFNDVTLASATEAYVDNENRSAADVSAWLDTLDDNGNSSLRGTLYVYVPATPGVNFRIYSVSGSVVDGTGYRKLTIAHVAGGGSFTNGAEIDLLFVPRGPAGSGLADVVDDTTPQLGGNLDTNTRNIDFTNGTAIRGGANAADTMLIQARDVNGAAYATAFRVTSNDSPGLELVDIDLDTNGKSVLFDDDTGIRDDSGNEQLIFEKTASAVNELGIKNAATGNAPQIKARGETDVGINIVPRGTGTLQRNGKTVLDQERGATLDSAFGIAVTAVNDGTKTTGTFTPTFAAGNTRRYVNGGAHTLAPPTGEGTMCIQITNDGSAGAITTSGFTWRTGDDFTTTSGHDFLCYITVVNGFSLLNVVALQ